MVGVAYGRLWEAMKFSSKTWDWYGFHGRFHTVMDYGGLGLILEPRFLGFVACLM